MKTNSCCSFLRPSVLCTTQNKTKQSKVKESIKAPCGDFCMQIILSSENFDDVKCEDLLRILVVWSVMLGWLVG